MSYKDPEAQRAYQLRVMRQRRRAWLKEHGPCVRCRGTKQLEVDHVDPSTKVSHNVWSWSEKRRAAELAKCQVLCKACHNVKSAQERKDAMQHGTEGMYRFQRCRCDACREWKRQKSRKEATRRRNAAGNANGRRRVS